MKYLTHAIAGFGAIALILCFVAGLTSMGGQGWLTIGLAAGATALGALGLKQGMSRGMAIGAAVLFLLVAMKTSSSSGPLSNIMMAAAGGLIVSIIRAIKPSASA